MTIKNMKQTTFDEADFAQWKTLAIDSLKGKPYERLMTKTLEGIKIQPLYSEKTDADRTSTIRQMKGKRGWTIAQQTIAESASTFLEQLQTSLERGNEAIVYDGTVQFNWSEDELAKLSGMLKDYPVYMFNIDEKDTILQAFDCVDNELREQVIGIVDAKKWTPPEGYINLRTKGVDMWDLHHAGADAVTELAVALALASKLSAGSHSFPSFSSDFFVRFAIDTHFFMEIAKIRAFRLLWTGFARAFDIEKAPIIPIAAVTSIRSYSKLDPYVNLLRGGNETFAAILGGADIITTEPHDILTGPSASSIRYSRNIQLVLKEETHIDKVLDPAGGSYFIEKLTEELVHKAWSLFLDIEANGGVDLFKMEDHLLKLATERKDELATGKKSLVGTNTYAQLIDTELKDWKGIKKVKRPAEMFEHVREKSANSQPKTVVLTFGQLKDFKPRMDFVTGFLATGGIHSQLSAAYTTVEEAIEWLQTEKPDYVVVCANDDLTKVVMGPLLEQLPAGIVIDVAGKLDKTTEQAWKEKGLSGMMYNGQDKIAKLQSIQELGKGGQHK